MITRFLPLILMGSLGYKNLDKLKPLLQVSNVTVSQSEVGNIAQVLNIDRLDSSLPGTDPASFANYLRKNLKRSADKSKRDMAADPWGNAYRLKVGKNNSFQVSSAGPDGRFGTNDDIRAGILE